VTEVLEFGSSSVMFTGMLVCRCVVPSVTVNTPVLNLGHCFLGHPYQCHVELVNNTDLPAKYDLLTCSAVGGLDSVMYTSPQPQVGKGAITSKIKHAIKLKTNPARLAQLLQAAALISILY